MRALNATVFRSNNLFASNLDAPRLWPNWHTDYTKREDRRRQRHELRTELPALVARSLEAEGMADQDSFDDFCPDNYYDFAFEFAYEKVGEATLLRFSHPTNNPDTLRASRVVTVIRKRANQRRVVQQLKIAA
jgi:hypothetical protein